MLCDVIIFHTQELPFPLASDQEKRGRRGRRREKEKREEKKRPRFPAIFQFEFLNSLARLQPSSSQLSNSALSGLGARQYVALAATEKFICNMSEQRKDDSERDEMLNRDDLEALFKQPEPTEECPICMIPLPLDRYYIFILICCGKRICSGCSFALAKERYECGRVDACPFCREEVPEEPESTDDKTIVAKVEKLAEKGYGTAFHLLAQFYAQGMHVQRDVSKAVELYKKGGEHGCAEAYGNLARIYYHGENGEVDKKKAKHYYALAAMMGDVTARIDIASMEKEAGSTFWFYRHLLVSARAGHEDSIAELKNGYKDGFISKDEYAESLRLYQMRSNEMKSKMREEAARFDEIFQDEDNI